MSTEFVLEMVGSYGYVALFAFLFLGIVGLPINDETLVMLGGFVAAQGILRPLPTFLVTYLGVLSGMNIGFVLGRLFGSAWLDRMCARSPRVHRQVQRAQDWLTRYGTPVIILTYYVPGVRHVVPYLIGISHMPYWRFALIAFSGALIWTGLFFWAGYVVGDYWEQVAGALNRYGVYFGLALAAVVGAIALLRRRRTPRVD